MFDFGTFKFFRVLESSRFAIVASDFSSETQSNTKGSDFKAQHLSPAALGFSVAVKPRLPGLIVRQTGTKKTRVLI